MVVTSQGGKQTINPPMSYVVDTDTRKDDELIEVSREHKNATEKEKVVLEKDDDRLQHCSAIATESLV